MLEESESEVAKGVACGDAMSVMVAMVTQSVHGPCDDACEITWFYKSVTSQATSLPW